MNWLFNQLWFLDLLDFFIPLLFVVIGVAVTSAIWFYIGLPLFGGWILPIIGVVFMAIYDALDNSL